MIKIDVDTRMWEIPEEEKFLGVESDGNVKKYKFELSKNEFYKGLNFTDCNCFINYKNEDNEAIPYGITDMKAQSDGKVTFTWEVSRSATIFKGNTLAVLCVKKVRDDGTITNEWNSRIGAFIVNKGIEPNENIAEVPEIDIISQLLNIAQNVNQIAQQNISKSEENIAKSEELINKAEELMDESNFFKEYIVDGDSYSGMASNKGIKLHSVKGKTVQQTTNGYQLFDASKLPTKTIGGETLTNNGDGSFTISGSGNLSAVFNYYYYMGRNPLKVGRLTLELNGTNSIIPLMQVVGLNKLGDSSNQNRIWDLVNNESIDITQELLEQTKDIFIVFYANKGKEIKAGTIKPMLYQDGDGTWEQYTGGQPAPNPDYPMPIENVEINVITSHGKNILPNYAKDKVMNGITYKVNPDKSIKITGTANGITYIELVGDINDYQTERFRVDDDYVISGINSNDLILSARNIKGNYVNVYVNGAPEYDIKGVSLGCIYIQVPTGKTVDLTVYPQIELGSVATDYQPYNVIETSLTLAQDDIYQNGTITGARKQVTFDGSSDEGWTASSNPNIFYITLSDKSTETSNEMLSNRFVKIERTTLVTSLESGQMKEDGNNPKIVYFKVDGITSVSDFKTWLQSHPTTIEYELATPTTEEFKVPTIPSYYPYTNVSTDCNLETEIKYELLANSDNSLYLEELEKRIQALEQATLER